MFIVNQTVPRALRNLGYTDEQVDAIVAHIDEHKTIIGAPRLQPEHLPVFACSMGDNTIHYMGHVKMMGAVQPFISGAISKTVNMPEEATVEDVEQLHIEAWKLGPEGRRRSTATTARSGSRCPRRRRPATRPTCRARSPSRSSGSSST